MKTCVSCKINKDISEYIRYTETGIRRLLCKECYISKKDGVSQDMASNNRNLKNKAFSGNGAVNITTSSLHFRDCAINEMGIDYDEFENIKDIGEIDGQN